MNLIVYADGFLTAGDKAYRAVYGKNGIGPKTREGDGISPEGTWPIRKAFYRPDRLEKPKTRIETVAMQPNDAWCDIQGDLNYNQFVTLPSLTRDERLWREDHRYDLVVVLGYNDAPVIDGAGSAIFFHIARPDYTPTAGCAGISLPDMLEVMPCLEPDSTLTFTSRTLKGGMVLWPYHPLRLG